MRPLTSKIVGRIEYLHKQGFMIFQYPSLKINGKIVFIRVINKSFYIRGSSYMAMVLLAFFSEKVPSSIKCSSASFSLKASIETGLDLSYRTI